MLRALTSVLIATTAALAPPADARPAAGVELVSVQTCNTQCQSRFTDCVLACDGDVPCERRCQAEVTRCVEGCQKPASPAPSAAFNP